MADVVLVQPRVGSIDSIIYGRTPPLALLSLASFLVPKYSVKIIDQRIPGWKDNLSAELKKKPLCVGITSMTGAQIKSALEVSGFVKDNSSVPVVWGGIHPTLEPEQTLANPLIDYIVLGEGERPFRNLVDALASGKGPVSIKGVCRKDKAGRIFISPPAAPRPLCNAPEIPYGLLDMAGYLPVIRGRKTLFVESSRGCPFSCSFCFSAPFYHKGLRVFDERKITARLKRLRGTLDFTNIRFVDANFFASRKHYLSIARHIRLSLPGMKWDAQGHIATFARMSDNDLHILASSGLELVIFGVESGSQRIVDSIGKCFDVRDVSAVNHRLKRHGIIPQFNFMCGLPSETEEDMGKSIDLALKLLDENDSALVTEFSVFTPFPKTAALSQLKPGGFTPPGSLEGWARLDSSNLGGFTWIESDMRRKLGAVNYASIFMDSKIGRHYGSALFRAYSWFYRPVALLRLKRRWFGLPIEAKLNNLFLRMISD